MLFHFLGHKIIVAMTIPPISSVYQFILSGPCIKYTTFIAEESALFVDTPKKLSNCPIAIIKAIPVVNPVITGAGI